MKCNNCGKEVVKFPLRDSNGKLIIKNLFKIDLMSVIWFIIIILAVITYKTDIKTCEEITTNPLEYCEESNACKVIEERKGGSPFGLINIEEIKEIDDSG